MRKRTNWAMKTSLSQSCPSESLMRKPKETIREKMTRSLSQEFGSLSLFSFSRVKRYSRAPNLMAIELFAL